MKKKQTNAFEFEAIKSGHYAVICTAKAAAPGHPVSFGYLVEQLQKVWRDLKKHNSATAGAAVVVEDLPDITLKLVVPRKTQGALIARGDEHCIAGMEGSAGPSVFAPLNGQVGGSPLTLEESAMVEAEEIARAAARVSKGAIDAASTIVEKAEQESLSVETATPAFAASPDERVTRNAYCRARGGEQILSFLGDERLLGGGHAIPNQLYSQATFALTQCKVAIFGKNNSRYLQGNAEDPEWQRLIEWSGFVVDELDGDEASDEMFLLRLAEATNQLVDVDVCIKERMSTKGRRLVPLRVRNRSDIMVAIKDRLEVIGE